MDLSKISDQDLIFRLEKLTRTERKITHFILLHINELEARQLYAGLGFESLYTYLTKGLCYSESAAYRRIQAARLLKTMPEVAEKIESGALNLSQLTQVQKCLKEEKKKGQKIATEKVQEILNTLENKSGFESERILALEFNQPVKTRESVRPQQDESVRIEISFSKEQFEILKQAQSLLSHICPEGKWNEVLTTLALKFNQSKLGKEPQSKNISRSNTGAENLTEAEAAQSPEAIKPKKSNFRAPQACRPYISIRIKRRLLAKARHECEFIDPMTRKKCTSRFHLEIDHIRPLALGGTHEESNMRILCRTHNTYEARSWGLRRPSVEGLAQTTPF
jgi:hypothetical protein